MQAWLEFVVKGLVGQPEQVRITAVEKSGVTHYELRVAATDMGQVVGKHGATIKALRTLLQAGALNQGRRCTVELVEESPPA
jgi:predicted RNA-binding protein YlqC (UPF0109 family)